MITEQIRLIVQTGKVEVPQAGCEDAEILENERELGRLPGALRDFYATIGKHPALLTCDYQIPRLEQLRIHDSHLVFCEENQGGACWAIEADNLAQPNPRVVGKAPREKVWSTESSSLSAFLINLVCWQTIMLQPEIARADLDEDNLDRMERLLDFIGEEDVRLGALGVSFVGRKDPMLATYLYDAGQLYVGARDPETLKRFKKDSKLNLDWL